MKVYGYKLTQEQCYAAIIFMKESDGFTCGELESLLIANNVPCRDKITGMVNFISMRMADRLLQKFRKECKIKLVNINNKLHWEWIK